MYDDNDEFVETSKYYETEIPKQDYNNKLNSIQMKVTYESGIINMEDVTDKKSE